MKLIIILCAILILSGCNTPRQELARFESKYNLAPVKVEYNWLPLKTHPHAKDGKIIINATALSGYKVCESEILIHERCHIAGLKHCEIKGCLMYYRLHRIHILSKTLCDDCKSKLRNLK
jgi:hypothetical protein